MSLAEADKLPRLKDYMKPEELNSDGCLELAATVLGEQADALYHAARNAARQPNPGNLQRLRELRDFYKTDWYKALSMGLADGEQVAQQIIKRALRGVNVKGGQL